MKQPKYKPLLFLVVAPSVLTAILLFALYFILMPLFPVIHQYYFPQSTDTYRVYHTAIMGHILFGTIAIILGPINLYNALRGKHFGIHRKIGSIYAVAVSISAICAVFMSFHAYAGTLPYGRFVVTSGFFTLGCLWLGTLYAALYQIMVKHDKERHFFFMIINVSLVYSAFVLRLWIGVITGIDKFDLLYPTLGWIGWLPSAVVGYLLARRRYRAQIVGRDVMTVAAGGYN